MPPKMPHLIVETFYQKSSTCADVVMGKADSLRPEQAVETFIFNNKALIEERPWGCRPIQFPKVMTFPELEAKLKAHEAAQLEKERRDANAQHLIDNAANGDVGAGQVFAALLASTIQTNSRLARPAPACGVQTQQTGKAAVASRHGHLGNAKRKREIPNSARNSAPRGGGLTTTPPAKLARSGISVLSVGGRIGSGGGCFGGIDVHSASGGGAGIEKSSRSSVGAASEAGDDAGGAAEDGKKKIRSITAVYTSSKGGSRWGTKGRRNGRRLYESTSDRCVHLCVKTCTFRMPGPVAGSQGLA